MQAAAAAAAAAAVDAVAEARVIPVAAAAAARKMWAILDQTALESHSLMARRALPDAVSVFQVVPCSVPITSSCAPPHLCGLSKQATCGSPYLVPAADKQVVSRVTIHIRVVDKHPEFQMISDECERALGTPDWYSTAAELIKLLTFFH